MQSKPTRIIAVNPGWRHTGIAVFRESELDDWWVKSMRQKTVDQAHHDITAMISDIMDTNKSEVLAIKKLHPARSSKNLMEITKRLKNWAARKGLLVCEYSIKEIEAFLLSSGRLNKTHLMEEVAARYPILYSELEKGRRSKSYYLGRAFEAVALGMICLTKLEGKSKGRSIIN
ncbi:MAG TPA: hypothetical protein VLX91_10955 [Candidatus Acidoferrales bacterium]|nr:hypothetical protein [Candidatus Acidoferrales bacterium]